MHCACTVVAIVLWFHESFFFFIYSTFCLFNWHCSLFFSLFVTVALLFMRINFDHCPLLLPLAPNLCCSGDRLSASSLFGLAMRASPPLLRMLGMVTNGILIMLFSPLLRKWKFGTMMFLEIFSGRKELDCKNSWCGKGLRPISLSKIN